MKKYEYVALHPVVPNEMESFEQRINELGKQGWKLMGGFITGEYSTFIMEREIPEPVRKFEAPEISPEAEEHPTDR